MSTLQRKSCLLKKRGKDVLDNKQTPKQTSDCFIYINRGCYYTCTLYHMHYVQGNILSSTKVKGSYLLLTAYTHDTYPIGFTHRYYWYAAVLHRNFSNTSPCSKCCIAQRSYVLQDASKSVRALHLKKIQQHGNVFETHDRIIFQFYTRQSHMENYHMYYYLTNRITYYKLTNRTTR